MASIIWQNHGSVSMYILQYEEIEGGGVNINQKRMK